MNANLMDMAKDYLSPDVIRKFGSQLGETPEATQKGLSSAIPAVMGGFVRQATSDPSGAGVTRLLTEGQRNGDKLEDMSSVMTAGGAKTETCLSRGQRTMGGVLSDRTSSAVGHVAGSSGLGQRASGKILALAGSVVGAVLSREALAHKLGPSGLASMLAGQKDAVTGALGAGGLTSIFGGGTEWKEGV